MSARESTSVPSRSNTTAAGGGAAARSALASVTFYALHHVTDEERSHLDDELGRLTRLSHRLDDVRQRMQRLADETDDELVVFGVEPMAREPDVVSEVD